MITEKEFQIVTELTYQKEQLKKLLLHFDSIHVTTKIGLVNINAADKSRTQKSDHADWFNREFKPFIDELTEITIKKIQTRIDRIDFELVNYLKKDDIIK